MSDPRAQFPDLTKPDTDVREAALARQLTLTKPPGALGRLEDLSVWVSACQGVCPPKQFERARIVVFAGDHGVTASGVSAFPSEVTAQMVANFDAGGAAINVLAEVAGATVRAADIAVDGEAHSPAIGAHKVRRGSGNAVWDVRVFGPWSAQYIVAWLRDDYGLMLVARDARDYAWVFSRTPDVTAADMLRSRQRLQDIGYDLSKWRTVPQAGTSSSDTSAPMAATRTMR